MELPMAPSCALDESGLRDQLERYRRAGRDSRLLERTERRLRVRFASGVDTTLVGEAVAVERECCPFFTIDWDEASRELDISVQRPEHEPALQAIEHALGLAG